MNLSELIKDNYNAVVARGLINNNTQFSDFMDKLDEEVTELKQEYLLSDKFVSELIDCICVLTSMAHHYNIDVEQGLKNNAFKNWDMAKNSF